MAEPTQSQEQQQEPAWWTRQSTGKRILWTFLSMVALYVIITTVFL